MSHLDIFTILSFGANMLTIRLFGPYYHLSCLSILVINLAICVIWWFGQINRMSYIELYWLFSYLVHVAIWAV